MYIKDIYIFIFIRINVANMSQMNKERDEFSKKECLDSAEVIIFKLRTRKNVIASPTHRGFD